MQAFVSSIDACAVSIENGKDETGRLADDVSIKSISGSNKKERCLISGIGVYRLLMI